MKQGRSHKAEESSRPGIRVLELSTEDWQEFEHGVRLFNGGKFWHAHEAWEQLWKRHKQEERKFFQGLIQLAAAFHHLVVKKSAKGMNGNFDKACDNLGPYLPEYLGVNVETLFRGVEACRSESDHVGSDDLERFDYHLIPRIEFHKPTNPDLLVEIRDVVRSAEFNEGMGLFNSGYFWESHEVWEELWRSQDGDGKEFAEAFSQLAGGYSFIKLGKLGSARYLLDKSVSRLRQFEYLPSGVDISCLVGEVQPVLELLAEMPATGNLNGRLRKPSVKLQSFNGHRPESAS
jgi:predicted metal-dependent hydrolase